MPKTTKPSCCSFLQAGKDEFIYSGKLVTDIYLSFKLSPKLTLFAGIDNLFNIHPDLGINPKAKYRAFIMKPVASGMQCRWAGTAEGCSHGWHSIFKRTKDNSKCRTFAPAFCLIILYDAGDHFK